MPDNKQERAETDAAIEQIKGLGAAISNANTKLADSERAIGDLGTSLGKVSEALASESARANAEATARGDAEAQLSGSRAEAIALYGKLEAAGALDAAQAAELAKLRATVVAESAAKAAALAAAEANAQAAEARATELAAAQADMDVLKTFLDELQAVAQEAYGKGGLGK